MIELSDIEMELPRQTLEGGLLEPAMNLAKQKQGYSHKYTVRVPLSEGGSSSYKELTYYLKPDSEESKLGIVDRYIKTWNIVGDVYDSRPQVEVLPEGTTYQFEETDNPDHTKTTRLTLAFTYIVSE